MNWWRYGGDAWGSFAYLSHVKEVEGKVVTSQRDIQEMKEHISDLYDRIEVLENLLVKVIHINTIVVEQGE